METISPFDLNELHRDWIVGVTGDCFYGQVRQCILSIEAQGESARTHGVLIGETDPVAFAAAFFAALALRVPVVLMNPNWGEGERDELCRLVSPVLSFGRGFNCEGHRYTQMLPAGSILIPTGGTTGGVKLAIHTWASLESACSGVQEFLGGAAIDSCCVLPLFHVSGLMQLLRSFISGGRIRFDEDEVTGCCLSYVPTQLQRALTSEARIQQIATARAIFVGGAALSESIAQRARALKLPIVPVYGMTETAAMIAAVPTKDFLQDAHQGAIPIGQARFQIELDGRLRIYSPTLFQGYQGQSPIDRAAGYVTDDEARIDVDGRLHVLGRVDRLINSGGEKIDPREVEAALLRIEGVREVLVIGQPDPEWGQKVVAYYTGTEVGDLKVQLRQWLAPHKTPKAWIHVDRLPVSSKEMLDVGASFMKSAEHRVGDSDADFINEAPTPVLPQRKTQNLRKGRRSLLGTRYFITICTKDRRASLADPVASAAILKAWRLQHTDDDYEFHCGTVMPDHIHFLFTLGDRLSLGKSIIKFKAKTKEALCAVGLSWQRDFYDHWLRADDSMEGFAKYIYLNPYRKSLLALDEAWPHWHVSRDYRPEFLSHLTTVGTPPNEWLGESIAINELIDSDMLA